MQAYLDVLEDVKTTGFSKGDRTNTGTTSKFGKVMRFDLTDNKLPVLTTKKIYLRSVIHELIWFLSGSTDLKYLKDNKVSIWDSWVNFKTATYTKTTPDYLFPSFSFEVITEEYLGLGDVPSLCKARTILYKDEYVILTPRGKTLQIFITDKVNQQYVTTENVHRYLEDTLLKGRPYTTELLSGSIGEGAYGTMWRGIDDTRVIDEVDLEEYRGKGFEDNLGMSKEGKVVVSRKIDQIANVIHLLKTNPDSRRIIVSAFDPRQVDFCALPPCHSWFLFWTRELTREERLKEYALRLDHPIQPLSDTPDNLMDTLNIPTRALRCMLVQRSGDIPTGIPFNLTQYSLLTHVIADVTGMVAEEFVHVISDAHVYDDQLDLVSEQLTREIHPQTTTVRFNDYGKDINSLKFEDIIIDGYDKYHPPIKYPVAV